MPSPLAHVGVCVCAYAAWAPRLDPRRVGVVAFASVAPDLDLLIGVALGTPVGWHRGPTHSLLGALAIGCLLALLVRGLAPRVFTVAAAVVHVPMDFSTGNPGDDPAYGVPWAWPWSAEKAIAADPWFGSFQIDHPGFLLNLLEPSALRPWAVEAATVAAAVAVAIGIRRLR